MYLLFFIKKFKYDNVSIDFLINLNLLFKILKYNGIYNLNPYESNSDFIIDQKYNLNKQYKSSFYLIKISKLFFINLKNIYSVYKKFFITKLNPKKINLNTKNILVSYEDCLINRKEDKYFGKLSEKLNSLNSKNCSEIYIDVFGCRSSSKSILHLVSFFDAIIIFFISQFFVIYLIIKLLIPNFSSKQVSNKNYYLELLNQPIIYRLLFWDCAFKKFFRICKKDSSIVFLAEGSSWEWILLYNCPSKKKIFGYIHAIARPDQFSLYKLINRFSKTKKLSMLLCEDWSLNRLQKFCRKDISFQKIENLRFNSNLKLKSAIKKQNIDILVIGGLDGNLTKDLVSYIFSFIKKRKNKDMNLVVKEHPDNKKIYLYKKYEKILSSSKIDLNEAIIRSKIIFVSSFSAGCIDVKRYNKKCFIYLPNNILDLCPLPSLNRNRILNRNQLFDVLSNINIANKNALDFDIPFFFNDKELKNWILYFN